MKSRRAQLGLCVGAIVAAILLALIAFGVGRGVQTGRTPRYLTLDEAIADLGAPLLVAGAHAMKPWPGSASKQRTMLHLAGVSQASGAVLQRRQSDYGVVVFSDTRQFRVLVEEFCTSDVPAGRASREVTLYPHVEAVVLEVDASGRVLSEDRLEAAHVLLESDE